MANERFKVKFGLAVGDTSATIDATTGDIVTAGDIQLGGNNIKSSTTNSAITLNDVNVKVDGELTVTGNRIRSSGGTAFPLGDIAVQLSGSNVEVVGDLTVTGNDIKGSGGTTAITMTGADVAVAGDLTVTGNDIKSSSATAITLSGADVAVAGDLTVTGNDIKSSSATAITLSGADVAVAGDLTVTGNDIKGSGGTAISLSGINATVQGTLNLNGGVLETNQTIATLFNANATTVKVGEAATTVSIGANTGTTTINNSLVADDISILTVDTTNLEVTNIKAKDGTAAMTIANTTGAVTVTTSLQVDNIDIRDNTISSTNTNGAINLTPNGTGTVVIPTADVTNLDVTNIRALDGTAAASIANSTGVITVSTELNVDNINVSGNTIISTNTNGNINLEPNGTGQIVSTKLSTLAGVDKTLVVGGASATAGNFATITGGGGATSPTLYVANDVATRLGVILVRDYGQNRPGGTSSSGGSAQLSLEHKRGLPSSTGSSFVPTNGALFAAVSMGGYNGERFSTENAVGLSPLNIQGFATELWNFENQSFTASISGTTMTVTAVASGVITPGCLLLTGGALAGTFILSYGTGTGGTGTYVVSRSQTLASTTITSTVTTASGARHLYQAQPTGLRLDTGSRLNYNVLNWIAPSTSTVSGVTIPQAPQVNFSFGNNSLSVDQTYTNTAGTQRYRSLGGGSTSFVNQPFSIIGVTGQDSATFTADISGTTMTVSAVSSGIITPGSQVYGTGVSQLTSVTAQTTNTATAAATIAYSSGGGTGTTTITLANTTGVAIGQWITGTGMAAGAVVTAVNTSTNVVTFTPAMTGSASGDYAFLPVGKEGTYTVSPSQTVASTTMVSGPDDYTLRGSNSLAFIGSRRSGVSGRRNKLFTDDIIGQVNFFGTHTNASSSVATANRGARITAMATEEFTPTAGGSKLDINVMKTGTTTETTVASFSPTETIYRTDAITITDSTGAALPGGKIDYKRVHGCFHKIANVTAAAADTVYEFDWFTDTTAHVGNQGVTVTSGNPTRVNIDTAGRYTAFIEMQVKNTLAAPRTAWIWLAKNGTDIAETRIKADIKQGGTNDAYQLISKLWLLDDIAANDYIEVRFAVDNVTGISLEYEAAQTTPFVMPAQPSATLTIVPVGA